MIGSDKNTLQYKETSIASARPEDLTLMMYNGLLKFIARAQEEIRAKKPEAAHNTLIRCQDIVFEFQYTLNMDYTVSNNLMLLYDYIYNRLIEANAKKNCDILNEVTGFVTELRDTWTEAVKINKEYKTETAEAAESTDKDRAGSDAALPEGETAGAPENDAQRRETADGGVSVELAPTEADVPAPPPAPPGPEAQSIARTKAIYTRNGAQASLGRIRALPPTGGAAVSPGGLTAPRINANTRPAASPVDAAANPGTAAANPAAALVNPGTAAANPTAALANPGTAAANPAAAVKIPAPGIASTTPARQKTVIPFTDGFGSPGFVNPLAAAQYAKIAKAKTAPREKISVSNRSGDPAPVIENQNQ